MPEIKEAKVHELTFPFFRLRPSLTIQKQSSRMFCKKCVQRTPPDDCFCGFLWRYNNSASESRFPKKILSAYRKNIWGIILVLCN